MNLSDKSRQCVVLLHGLARTRRSMAKMERALHDEGYFVINYDYPSRQLTIDELAHRVIDQCLQNCRKHGCQQINFVTHSMGGILVRHYYYHHPTDDLQRVVMLGPPNQGSEAVDRLKNLPGFYWLNGPAGVQLGTSEQDMPRQLGAANFELGVIAGRRSINLLLSSMIPGQDDGKVSVESTKMDGMTDFISLPCTHTFMMRNSEVIRQTLFFLEHGHFLHSSNTQN
jgi:pimeloyl-ACP methyl ester carboxylesterase